jgi:hypothetical protein
MPTVEKFSHYFKTVFDAVSSKTRFSFEEETVLDLLECASLSFYPLYRTHKERKLRWADVAIAATTFIKMQVKGSMIMYIARSDILEILTKIGEEQATNVYKGGKDLFGKVEEFFDGDKPDINPDSDFSGFNVNTMSMPSIDEIFIVTEAPLMKKIHRVLCFCITYSVFQKAGIDIDLSQYMRMDKDFQKSNFKYVDFVHSIVDILKYIYERGYDVYQSGQFTRIFSGPECIDKYIKKIEVLENMHFTCGNPEVYEEIYGKPFVESTFLAEMDDVIEKAENLLNHASHEDRYHLNRMRNLLNRLKIIRADTLTRRNARKDREAPYGILIFGDSGIGKTHIKNTIFFHFAKVNGLEAKSEFCHTLNPGAKYWDNFNTSQHTIIMDDIAFLKPSAAPQGDPSLLEVIQVMNPVAYTPDQARLEDKGRTPLRAKLVIATSNVENLNAFHYFACPSAVQRRFPFIVHPVVRPEYATPDGCLDSSKLPEVEDNTYQDYWLWTVKRVRPVSVASRAGSNAIIEIIEHEGTYMEKVGIREFLVWFNASIKDHNKTQKQMDSSRLVLEKTTLTDCCNMPLNLCDCVQSLQYTAARKAAFTFLYDWFWWTVVLHIIITLINIGIHTVYFYQTFHNQVRTVGQAIRLVRWYLDFMDRLILPYRLWLEKMKVRYCLMRDWSCETWRNKRPQILKGIYVAISTLAFVGAMYQTFKWWSKQADKEFDLGDAEDDTSQCDIQGGSVSRGYGPSAEEQIKQWYKDDFVLSDIRLSKLTNSYNQFTPDQLARLFRNNLCELEIYNPDEDTRNINQGFMVCSNIVMLNAHAIWQSDKMVCKVTFQQEAGQPRPSSVFSLAQRDVFISPGGDIAFIKIGCAPPKKSFIDLFIDDRVPNGMIGYSYNIRHGYVRKLVQKGIVHHSRCKVGTLENLVDIYSAYYDNSDNSYAYGDCGSILVITTPRGPVIGGIHVASSKDRVLTLKVTSSDVRLALAHFEEEHKITPNSFDFVDLNAESAKMELGPLHKKSIFRSFSGGVADVHGSFIGFRHAPKSRVENTKMHDFLKDYGYEKHYYAPVMRGSQPWQIAASDMLRPQNKFNSSVMKICIDGFIKDIQSKIAYLDLSKHIFKLDDTTTMNGAPGITFIDKMNRATSAGNPWKCPKKRFLMELPPDGELMHPVEFTQEIKDRVEKVITAYESGHLWKPVFCAHLKDEPVDEKKSKTGKTRVFVGAPCDWSFVVRKYYLAFVRVMQLNKFAFEAAPGTTPQSSEWDDIYRFITEFGEDRIVAGDYKAFDKRMSPTVILGAFQIIRHFLMESTNFEEIDFKVIDGLAQDTAYPLIDFNGDLVQFWGSNPSGHPLTVIINSLANSLYMRYAYYSLNPEKEVDTFAMNVRLMTYGDDNIMGVSPNVPWFNHTTISAFLNTMDVTYTMADKEAESVPYIHIKDANFLKRTWRFDKETGFHLGPLALSSIEKSLMVWTRSKEVCWEKQCHSILHNAIREYFFHGKDVFEEKREIFLKLIEHLELTNWFLDQPLPTYIQTLAEFDKACQVASKRKCFLRDE